MEEKKLCTGRYRPVWSFLRLSVYYLPPPAQQVELEDADLCFGVGDFPVHHHLHCLRKGNAQHIQKFSVVQLLHTLVQTLAR